MFIGDPPGNYDRLLDVSRAVTGSLYFIPPASFLDTAVGAAPLSRTAPDVGESNDQIKGAADAGHAAPRRTAPSALDP